MRHRAWSLRRKMIEQVLLNVLHRLLVERVRRRLPESGDDLVAQLLHVGRLRCAHHTDQRRRRHRRRRWRHPRGSSDRGCSRRRWSGRRCGGTRRALRRRSELLYDGVLRPLVHRAATELVERRIEGGGHRVEDLLTRPARVCLEIRRQAILAAEGLHDVGAELAQTVVRVLGLPNTVRLLLVLLP